MEIRELQTFEDLLGGGREDLEKIVRQGELLEPDEILRILKLCDCFWWHNGDPATPHMKLTSGRHSTGFVNVQLAIRHPFVMEAFALTLAERMREVLAGLDQPMPYWVIGSDHASAVLSQRVGYYLGATCTEFTEKRPDEVVDGKKVKVQVWDRHQILPGQIVAQVEELTTTLATPRAVRAGIRKGNKDKFKILDPVIFSPVMGVLVDRRNKETGEESLEETSIVSAVRCVMDDWEDEKVCVLCQQGSPVLTKKDWDQLKRTSK